MPDTPFDAKLFFERVRKSIDSINKREKLWRMYEISVADLERSFSNCTVTHNHRVRGRRSGIERQIDVWIEATVGDNHRVTIAMECRDHSRPLDIGDVDAFCGFLDDIGANKGVLVSAAGYTKGAEQRAESSGIELKVLSPSELRDPEWEQYAEPETRNCQGNCWGHIDWSQQWCEEDGDSIPPPYWVGLCDYCGALHIECGNCGTVDWYNFDGTIRCSGCEESEWELSYEKGDFVSICQVETEDSE